MNINEKQLQLALYGKLLNGTEPELVKKKLARAHFLKTKLRRFLEEANLGDLEDIVADVNKSLLLGLGIVSGLITNQEIISRYQEYVTAQIELYGGPAAIMDKLESNALVLLKKLGAYNEAKTEIAAAEDDEAVGLVDVERVPDNKETLEQK